MMKFLKEDGTEMSTEEGFRHWKENFTKPAMIMNQFLVEGINRNTDIAVKYFLCSFIGAIAQKYKNKIGDQAKTMVEKDKDKQLALFDTFKSLDTVATQMASEVVNDMVKNGPKQKEEDSKS